MSELSPAAVAGNAAVHGQEVLTPEAIEAVLADFRSWLQEVAPLAASPPPAPEERIDLHTLLGQLTALRHEVNLQTKAARSQQEQHAEALLRLGQSVDAQQQSQAAGQQADRQAQDDRLRPLLKTLVDLADALSLAKKELKRVQETLVPWIEKITAEPEPLSKLATERRPSFWARWYGRDRGAREAARQRQEELQQASGHIEQLLDSIITGYTMSLQRVERALQQHDLESIPCVGQPFDPAQMEVIEVVAGGAGPAGTVVDEVRRGYLWRGRVFRYAQVRVAKP